MVADKKEIASNIKSIGILKMPVLFNSPCIFLSERRRFILCAVKNKYKLIFTLRFFNLCDIIIKTCERGAYYETYNYSYRKNKRNKQEGDYILALLKQEDLYVLD